MLVRITFGFDCGKVVDLLPDNALAMLADGRAVRPDEQWPRDAYRHETDDIEVVESAPVVDARVSGRSDRGFPRSRKRRRR